MDAHREELALLETLDTGQTDPSQPARRYPRYRLRDSLVCRKLSIKSTAKSPHQRQRTGHDRSRTDWRDCGGSAVEFHIAAGLLAWPGAGVRQQRGAGRRKNPLYRSASGGLSKQAGLPDGVFNVVSGFGHEAGQALALHPTSK